VTYAQKLSRAESVVDWRRSAIDIDRQIRAFNPWPAAETRLNGEPVKLLRSRVATGNTGGASVPGALLGLKGDALEVACAQGVLQVLELQRAGRKPTTARDFHNSLRLAPGATAVFT
jgi:methionyl-tRNA formyltransferase